MCEQCKPDADTNAASGSRRRRLWDLPHACHCPVIGVCLPLNTLRTLVNKTLGGQAQADDYEIHVGAVAECMRRNRLSKRLQDELDRRYAQPIQAFRSARTAVEIAEMWAAAIRQGDVAGEGLHAAAAPVTQVICRLETGRTHQIRVHMASLGHPLLGDILYGGRALAGAVRQMLHARALRFDDPAGGAPLSFESSVPDDMLAVQEAIRWNS